MLMLVCAVGVAHTLPLASDHAAFVRVLTGNVHAVLKTSTGATAADLEAPAGTGASRDLDTGVLLHQELGGLAQLTTCIHTHV